MNIELLIKYFNGQALPEEAMNIHEWKSMNPDNLNIYNHLLQVWNSDYEYQNDIQFLELWNKLNRTKKKNKKWWYTSGIAASILVLIGLFFLLKRDDSIQLHFSYTAQKPIITLPDSNEVILAENSSLDFFQKNDSIHISIIGDVQFNIFHHLNNLNFSIGHDIYLKDIGTIFKIKQETNSLTIEVLDGKVLVSRFEYQTELKKNEQLIFDTESQIFTKKDRTINLHWENISLDKAIKEIEDYFMINVTLNTAEISQKKISFIADTVSMEEIFQIISETLHVNHSIREDEIFIY